MTRLLFFLLLISGISGFGQSPPWENPLKMAWSSDGKTFGKAAIFQDSSGVPSAIRWKGDTLICAFQWFRLPNPSPSWDRVAVKFSYDNGIRWTTPVPIKITGFPGNYQRPFDPALTVFGKDSLRICFSSSVGMPAGGMDASINTYSARSADGVNYIFEPGPRVDVATNRVIDPSVIWFKNSWHYLAPVGAPQQGAYHFLSPDGLNFVAAPIIPSDNIHNWTGNYMIENESELRFYGSGPFIWFNSSPNGGTWNGFVSTNIQGGDPTVIKVSSDNYLIIYVGKPYSSGTNYLRNNSPVKIYPNPVTDVLMLNSEYQYKSYRIFNPEGKLMAEGNLNGNKIQTGSLVKGIYFLEITGSGEKQKFIKFIKE